MMKSIRRFWGAEGWDIAMRKESNDLIWECCQNYKIFVAQDRQFSLKNTFTTNSLDILHGKDGTITKSRQKSEKEIGTDVV